MDEKVALALINVTAF